MNQKTKGLKLKSAHWRIVIPSLTQYTYSSFEDLMDLKYLILERLKNRPQDPRSSIKSQFQRGLIYYRIALEHHVNGTPHLDILLSYDKSIQRQVTDFDYLLKHGNVTTYRQLNSAIIDYGKKEDKQNLSNFPDDTTQVLNFQDLKKDPYLYLQQQMLKDPLHFNVEQYVRTHNLDPHIKGWASIKNKLKDMQLAAANLSLRQKPGFKFISTSLINQLLNPAEKKLFYSWSGYQTIVDYLNQIISLGNKRPMKTLNLLITGPASIGKTSLFHNPNHSSDQTCVQDFCAVYPMGMSTWFPQYRSHVYKLILWNEAKLTSYSYDTILKLLEGSYLDLPTKGSVAPKRDNPLVIMTSNLTLDQMIQQKFGYNKDYIQMARKNLAVRIQNVIVPKTKKYNLFLLQKLLVPL